MIDVITPIVSFLVLLVIVVILYLLAGRLEPPFQATKYKTKSYFCGEEAPPVEEAHQSYDFFHVAFYFTILHVGVLVVATAPVGASTLIAAVLIGVLALSAFALFVGGKDHA